MFVKVALQLKPEYQQKTTSFKRKNEIANTIRNAFIFCGYDVEKALTKKYSKHCKITPKRGK
jgi:hypothetical protein